MTQKIIAIGTLQDLIDIDKKDHKLKVIADLFVSAMTDWPTYNQTDISEFVSELKAYFGTPLTKDKISNKPINTSNQDVWRHEAGSSIIEMFKLADEFYSEQSFENILQDLFTYYENELLKVDFVADLKYFTTEEGGRATPTCSGYRPQVKFDFAEMQTSGQQTFVDKETVYPGDTVKAAIRIIGVDYFANCLTENMTFDLREASKIIGTGIITSILNDNLTQVAA